MERWEWFEADDRGWHRQVETWGNEALHLSEERSEFAPHPWMYRVNESFGVGLIRSGAYRRQARGVTQLVDANAGFFRFANEEVGVANFTGEPREVSYITVEPGLANGLFDTPVDGPAFDITPEIELDHQRLLVARRIGADDLMMELLALDILALAFAQSHRSVKTYSRRTTAASRRRLVNDACEVLHLSHHSIGLIALAETVGCSPFHLSRVFREITSMTIPQYRRQLRVHDAVTLIADGANDLASIAAAVGFADHSHMTRSIVAQFGTTPTQLRALLSSDELHSVTTD